MMPWMKMSKTVHTPSHRCHLMIVPYEMPKYEFTRFPRAANANRNGACMHSHVSCIQASSAHTRSMHELLMTLMSTSTLAPDSTSNVIQKELHKIHNHSELLASPYTLALQYSAHLYLKVHAEPQANSLKPILGF
jgi:hypothetical protein